MNLWCMMLRAPTTAAWITTMRVGNWFGFFFQSSYSIFLFHFIFIFIPPPSPSPFLFHLPSIPCLPVFFKMILKMKQKVSTIQCKRTLNLINITYKFYLQPFAVRPDWHRIKHPFHSCLLQGLSTEWSFCK